MPGGVPVPRGRQPGGVPVPRGVPTTLADLRAMRRAELHAVMCQGHPLDLDALANTAYRGLDLSLPGFMHRLLWETFEKTFVRDASAPYGLRGWNVRIQQTGLDGPIVPLRTRDGRPRTFGHYVVCPTDGRRFPLGWKGAHFLDYRCAGNTFFDPARPATAPLVAVNAGDMSLLLGWEIVNVGPLQIPLPLTRQNGTPFAALNAVRFNPTFQ